eukprot:GFKZ01012956.1.p2 GENE.GFKZ01012956.1~~GFKZ01012956.1.p2  ORF type:complete len:137 (-),score=6.70 GFKZ01012956.1:475-885(-)
MKRAEVDWIRSAEGVPQDLNHGTISSFYNLLIFLMRQDACVRRVSKECQTGDARPARQGSSAVMRFRQLSFLEIFFNSCYAFHVDEASLHVAGGQFLAVLARQEQRAQRLDRRDVKDVPEELDRKQYRRFLRGRHV